MSSSSGRGLQEFLRRSMPDRGGAEVTVAAKGAGALSGAEWVENYYGFAEPVSGAELERQGIAGAKRLGVGFEEDEIVAVRPMDTGEGLSRRRCSPIL